MAKKKNEKGYIQTLHKTRTDWDYYLPKEDKKLLKNWERNLFSPRYVKDLVQR